MFKLPATLRVRALLFVTLVFAVNFGMVLYLTSVQRVEDIDNAKMQLLHASQRIAAKQHEIVFLADRQISELMLLLQERKIGPGEKCSRLFAKGLKDSPEFLSMAVAAPNGDINCSSLPHQGTINLADRVHFQQALKTRQLVTSDVILSRRSDKPTIAFARAMRDEADGVSGVVMVLLELDWLAKELGNAEVPKGGHLGLLDAKGTVLSIQPNPQGWTGKDASGSPLFKAVSAQHGEGTAEIVGLDDMQRVVAFTPFTDTVGGRITLWLSLPREVITAHEERDFLWTMAITTALLLLAFGAVWVGAERMLLRPISALSEAARRVAQGDLNTRIGLGDDDSELSQLARNFDDMAGAIQSKETELSRTNRALRVLSAGNRSLRHAGDEATLLQEMCRAIVESGGYCMAWVGYAQDDAEKSVQAVASNGAPQDFLEALQTSWADTERGRGPVGTAIREATAVTVQNMLTDPSVQPWRTLALLYDYGSVLALPLKVNKAVIGVLTIYATEPDAFGGEEMALLLEASEDLSFGIAAHRARAREGQLEMSLKTAEDRYRAAAEANLDAMFILESVRDDTGNIVDFECSDINASGEKMLGMAREKVVGQKLREFKLINRAEGFFGKFVQVANTGQALEEEFRIDTPQTKAMWLRQQVVRVGDGIAISCRDITTWREASNLLRDSERALSRANSALKTIAAVDEVLVHANDELQMLRAVCEAIVQEGDYAGAAISYVQDDTQKTPAPLTFAGIIRSREGEEQRQRAPSIDLPLAVNTQIVGTLAIYAANRDTFDAEEIRLLEKLAVDLAYGIENLRTRAERDQIAFAHQHHAEILLKAMEDSVQAIAATVEMRDPYTAGHQNRVAALAVAIAKELALSEDTIRGLHLAAVVHDLGKVQVPAELLSKPGKLSKIEFELIKCHAQVGYEILKGIDFPWPIATIVQQHHERQDGSGYPQGLKGEQILLESRILVVADVVEAMASHRPYRASMGIDAALKEIEGGRGTLYDIRVVDACLKLFRDQQFVFAT